MPFDDLVQRADHPLGREREVDLNAQAFVVEVVQHVQKPELAAVGETVTQPIIKAFADTKRRDWAPGEI